MRASQLPNKLQQHYASTHNDETDSDDEVQMALQNPEEILVVEYIKKYGYPPKQPQHLVAFSNLSYTYNHPISYVNATSILTKIQNGQMNIKMKEIQMSILKKRVSNKIKTLSIPKSHINHTNVTTPKRFDEIELIKQLENITSVSNRINEIQNITNTKTNEITLPNKQRKPFQIEYKMFHWILIFLITLLTVLDRFIWNPWPLGVNETIPNGADWSVTLFYITAQISGRMMLISSSWIVFLENDIFWNWFYEIYLKNKSKWYFKYIKIENIKESHSHLHYYIGIYFIGIPVVLHVWTIILAAVSPKNDITFLSSWKRADKFGEKIPFYVERHISLGWNDTIRLITTSFCFFILFPYSMIKVLQKRNWSIAMYLHIIAAAIYMIDLIRVTSHPHTWFFNIPFLLWWICDRIYGIFFYRRCVGNLINKVILNHNEYIILYLRVNNKIKSLSSIGDIFYLNVLENSWDRAHPFTIFYNHKFISPMIQQKHINDSGHNTHKFPFKPKKYSNNLKPIDVIDTYESNSSLSSLKNTKSLSEIFINRCRTPTPDDEDKDEINESNDWNVGVIIKVHENHNGPCCDNRKTWSTKILHSKIRFNAGFRCWGPYRSDYNLLHNIEFINKYPLVLLSTGAGCGYMIDFYNYFISENIILMQKIEYYFSTSSVCLLQWFTNITCKKSINNFRCHCHTTIKNKKITPQMQNDRQQRKQSRDVFIGRMEFDELLNNVSPCSHVFYCGSPVLQDKIKQICKTLKLTFHSGHTF